MQIYLTFIHKSSYVSSCFFCCCNVKKMLNVEVMVFLNLWNIICQSVAQLCPVSIYYHILLQELFSKQKGFLEEELDYRKQALDQAYMVRSLEHYDLSLYTKVGLSNRQNPLIMLTTTLTKVVYKALSDSGMQRCNIVIPAWHINIWNPIKHHEYDMLHEGKICHIVLGYCIFYHSSLNFVNIVSHWIGRGIWVHVYWPNALLYSEKVNHSFILNSRKYKDRKPLWIPCFTWSKWTNRKAEE